MTDRFSLYFLCPLSNESLPPQVLLPVLEGEIPCDHKFDFAISAAPVPIGVLALVAQTLVICTEGTLGSWGDTEEPVGSCSLPLFWLLRIYGVGREQGLVDMPPDVH
jgi:hypothetical protein